MRFIYPSIDTVFAKRQLHTCQQKMDALRQNVPSFIMDMPLQSLHQATTNPNSWDSTTARATAASAIAHFLLSMHRVGTKFSIPHDETHACNAEPRVNELVQQLKLMAHDGEERATTMVRTSRNRTVNFSPPFPYQTVVGRAANAERNTIQPY